MLNLSNIDIAYLREVALTQAGKLGYSASADVLRAADIFFAFLIADVEKADGQPS